MLTGWLVEVSSFHTPVERKHSLLRGGLHGPKPPALTLATALQQRSLQLSTLEVVATPPVGLGNFQVASHKILLVFPFPLASLLEEPP